jgi:molybdate transport system ATP-binding protein
MKTLIKISGATVRFLDQLVFEGLDFDWKEGQHWAIIGSSGKELTAFLDTLLGRTMVIKGVIERPFAEAYQKEQGEKGEVHSFRDLMAVVSQKYPFRNKSNLQNFYYQQRFNSMESDDAVPVREYLSELECVGKGQWDLDRVLECMQLEKLSNESLIKLSNGETKRLTIASALLKNPKILLLDQPLTGLDVQTRQGFDQILKSIIDSGIHLIMSTHSNEIPKGITHVGVLGNKGIQSVHIRSEWKEAVPENWIPGGFDEKMLQDLILDPVQEEGAEIIRLDKVSIRYSGKTILNKCVWSVRAGEKWQLKGPNGAGKSTLLSLILGENPQAYANDIWLFGRKRGTGESIWGIKKQIGFVAPELSRYFPVNQTCIKVVLSGLFDTMGLFKKVSAEQEKLALDWLSLFRLSGIGQKLLKQVSLEEQRFVLLARALIKKPRLLVLDEASQGMDENQRLLFKKTIDQICTHSHISLIYVSHYQEDLPDCVNKVFELFEDN